MSSLKKFEYDGIPISFEFSDGNKMINAMEMAKPFGKPVANFLRFIVPFKNLPLSLE